MATKYLDKDKARVSRSIKSAAIPYTEKQKSLMAKSMTTRTQSQHTSIWQNWTAKGHLLLEKQAT
ncbi:hypothetical protein LAY41_25280 [Argonema galeatum A003/A1]|nr:hypothetical protein [Argonema galeatum A003/A1]